MSGTRCLLALVALYVGMAQSWDIAVTKEHVLEFYANGNITNSTRFDSANLKVVVYDEIHDNLLYVDEQSGGDRICSYDISSDKYQCHTEVNGRNIHGLAFDPATELLFFSDTNESSINWISLKHGSNNNIYGNLLVKTGDGIPTDLAVDSCRGYVYWININLNVPTIERVAFNGSMKENVFNFSRLAPHSLVIDQIAQKMYFTENQNSSVTFIWYTDLNGGNQKLLMSFSGDETGIFQPSSNTLTVSKSFLYFMNWCSECKALVWKLPKTSTNSYANFSLGTNIVPRSIVANYKIKENYQNIQDCEPLTKLFQNNSAGMRLISYKVVIYIFISIMFVRNNKREI